MIGLQEKVKTQYELNMNKEGYYFYSNYVDKDDLFLLERLRNLNKNNTEYILGKAFDVDGNKRPYVSLYIKK